MRGPTLKSSCRSPRRHTRKRLPGFPERGSKGRLWRVDVEYEQARQSCCRALVRLMAAGRPRLTAAAEHQAKAAEGGEEGSTGLGNDSEDLNVGKHEVPLGFSVGRGVVAIVDEGDADLVAGGDEAAGVFPNGEEAADVDAAAGGTGGDVHAPDFTAIVENGEAVVSVALRAAVRAVVNGDLVDGEVALEVGFPPDGAGEIACVADGIPAIHAAGVAVISARGAAAEAGGALARGLACGDIGVVDVVEYRNLGEAEGVGALAVEAKDLDFDRTASGTAEIDGLGTAEWGGREVLCGNRGTAAGEQGDAVVGEAALAAGVVAVVDDDLIYGAVGAEVDLP